MGVAAGDDEGEERLGRLVRGCRGCGFHEDGVDVAFEVVDGDEGLVESEGEGFGVEDADEEGSGESGAFGDGDGVEVGERDAGLGDGLADDGDDVAEVLARGKFGDHSSVRGVERDLAGDDVGEDFGAGFRGEPKDGGGGLVATAFDAQDEAGAGSGGARGGHLSILGAEAAGFRGQAIDYEGGGGYDSCAGDGAMVVFRWSLWMPRVNL